MSFETTRYDFSAPAQAYSELARDLAALLGDERDLVANLANAAALIYHVLPELNWAGFYLPARAASGARELVVGPFQGRPACVRIAFGRGVCGAAAVRRETIVVPDVAAFDDHIACDAASRSEIVVPMLRPDRGGDDALAGVLDLDSPKPGRFGDADRVGLERIANIIVASCAWPG